MKTAIALLNKTIDLATWAGLGTAIIAPAIALTMGATIAASPAVIPTASLIGVCARYLIS